MRLTAAEAQVLADGTAERLLELEERYGSQQAALAAHPELEPVARQLQRIRAKISAARRGVELELSGDPRPFPAETIARASRTFQRILDVRDTDALAEIAATSRLAGPGDDD
jgi:ABC-type Zn uptake system ZnuABC Zn-binding protein ZnuA